MDIRKINSNKELIENNSSRLDQLKNKLKVSNHYFLFHNDKFWDSNGIYDSPIDCRYYYYEKHDITPEQLLIAINHPVIGEGNYN